MFGFTKNTNEEKKNDDASKEDVQKSFELIFKNIEEGLVLFDATGTIKLFNPGAEKLSGWESKDANGINITQVLQLANEKG
jgi:PAS domain S-box-containing protein